MAQLIALSAEKHSNTNVSYKRASIYARTAHMLPIRVTEIAQAIVDFPIVISRISQTSDLSLSALASFKPGSNLFVSNENWDSGFQPCGMKTYPFYLMKPGDDESEPILGLDGDSPALNSEKGDALFTEKGKQSLWVSQVRALLLDDSRNRVHTTEFLGTLKTLNLFRPVDIAVNYADGEINRIRGLNMIHEENLKSLDQETFIRLREKGYLAPIYAMLFSTLQLNALIRRNNQKPEHRRIKSINLEVIKESRPI